MRKKVFFALGCVLYLTGCDSSSLEKVIPQTKFFPIQFSIQMEKEIVSFPTRSIPNNVIPEPTVSKAGESDAELNEICSTIEYVVFIHRRYSCINQAQAVHLQSHRSGCGFQLHI